MTSSVDYRPPRSAEHSVGELVKQASEQVARLVRDEMRLARAEMTEKGRRARLGGGLFGAAGVVAFLAAQALVAASIAAIALALPVWAAALIMGAVLLVVAAVLGLMGRKQVKRAVPPSPEQAIGSVKADLEEIRERTQHHGEHAERRRTG